jgi:hypothetical protein
MVTEREEKRNEVIVGRQVKSRKVEVGGVVATEILRVERYRFPLRPSLLPPYNNKHQYDLIQRQAL